MEINSNQLLRILPLRYKLRSAGLKFPGFSGAAWHGGLGMMLAQQSPTAFRCLYQTNQESRLYALLPTMESTVPVRELFELRITLFGPGVDHALAVTQAIAELGRIGMRPGGHYEMVEAIMIGPEGEMSFMSAQAGFIAMPQAFAVNEYLTVENTLNDACRIRFVTPLRIKDGNDLLRHAPGYVQVLRRIFGRLDQIAHVAQEAPPFAKSQRDELCDEAERVVIKEANISLQGIERRSARSGQQMQFNGLVGTVDYAGEMKYTLPWFRLASITQLGGKTAFGFGGLEVSSQV